MGNELAKLPVRPNGNSQGGTNPPQRPAAPSRPNAADRNSAAAGTAARPAAAAAGSGAAAGAGSGAAEKEKFSGLAPVTDTPPIPEAPKKKQRKPRTNTKKKEDNTSFNADQITALIVSLSSIFASRQGLEMFAITDIEARQIATPLSNIIAKNEKLNGMSEHADAIALVTACIVVMAPRFMLFFETQKQKKLKAAGGMKIVDKRKDENRESKGNDRKPTGTGSRSTENDVDGIFTSIPAII